MSVTLAPPMEFQFSIGGVPAVGYQLFTYVSGTSTKQATWTDSTQVTQNANPLRLDSNGCASVWIDPTLIYKFLLTTPNDTDPPSTSIYTQNGIQGPATLGVFTQAFIGQILYPQTAAEIAASVTPVNYAYAPLDVRRYGNPGGGYYPQSALLAAVNVAFYAKGAAFIAYGVNVLLTAPLDTLTTNIIRIQGAVDCWRGNQAETDVANLPTITCSNCALVGAVNVSTMTATYTVNTLKVLENVVINGIASATTAMVVQPYFAKIAKNCHIQNFSYFGIIQMGSSASKIGPCSTLDVGIGVNASGTLGTDGFWDGCACLSLVDHAGSGVTGNITTAMASASGDYNEGEWDLSVCFSNPTATSFKGFIAYNLQSTVIRMDGFGGVYLAYAEAFMPAPHLEIYSTGGAVAADGSPYAFVEFNSLVAFTKPFITTSPVGPNAPIAHIRNRNFPYPDVWDLGDRTYVNTIHHAQMYFGDYLPDNVSTASYLGATKGSAANPLAYYNATLNALLSSAGNNFYPLLPFPQFQSGSITTGNNHTTTTPPYSQWNLGGSAGNSDGGTEYEVSVLVSSSAGSVYHSSVWRCIMMETTSIIYNLAAANPLANVTVTAPGSGANATINIANATGSTMLYRVMYRLLGPAVGVPLN